MSLAQLIRTGGIGVLVALASVLPRPGLADGDRREGALICERAAVLAADETGVPLDVLRAISLTETGRKGPEGFLPWPWTVNMEGLGKWFDSRADARAYVDQHFARGARSFDVGCFQINYRWHGHAFTSIEQMFDPAENARYAARFLTELHQELGSWTKAAGAYHSRTPKYARKYTARFERIRARLSDASPEMLASARDAFGENPAPDTARANLFPLLQQGAPGAFGSLVPTSASNTRRFIDFSTPKSLIDVRQ